MTNVSVVEGDFRATDAKFSIVVARFNSFVVELCLPILSKNNLKPNF